MSQYFGFEGRVRRMTFWINSIVLIVINFIVSLIFVDVYLSWATGTYQVRITNQPIYYLITVILLWRVASITVRRFQDMDKDKEWAALLIPVFLFSLFPSLQYSDTGLVLSLLASICGLIAIGFLGFHPGDDGENRFGEEPEDGQAF